MIKAVFGFVILAGFYLAAGMGALLLLGKTAGDSFLGEARSNQSDRQSKKSNKITPSL